jgi:chromatin remodeling complex protein RSC6
MASIAADKLRREIQIILKDADLNTLSSKKVRQMLEAIFKCDFTDRKKEIDDILMSEITTRETTPIQAAVNQTNDEPIDTDDDLAIDEDKSSQAKKMKTESNNDDQKQQIPKSDEELAMEIHQQENRPSLRRPMVSLNIIRKKIFI